MKPLKAIALTLLAVAAALVSGCTPPNDSQDSSSGAEGAKYSLPAPLKEDDLYIYGDGLSYNQHLKGVVVSPAIRFTIISGKRLDPENIFLSAETDVPYFFSVFDISENNTDFPYDLFLAYNQGEEYFNLDWKEVYDKRKETEDLINKGKFQEAEEASAWEREYMEIYDRLARGGFPSFYVYLASINFHTSELEEMPSSPVEKITIEIEGQRQILPAKITFLPPYESPTGHGGVNQKTMAIGDYRLLPVPEGKCVLPPLNFAADEDIDLTGVSFFSETVTAQAARLIIENGGSKIDVLWDCKSPLKIKKGSEVEAVLIIRDRDFEGKLSYAAVYDIIFEYERGGTNSSFVIAVEGYTRLLPFEMLAILRDGVDLLPYYYDYYGRVSLEGVLK